MAAVIKVTRVIPPLHAKGTIFREIAIPVARIDTVTTDEIAEYQENEFTPTLLPVSRITKVNGEYILVKEDLDTVCSLIAHAGRN